MNVFSIFLLVLLCALICYHLFKHGIRIVPYLLIYNICFDTIGYIGEISTLSALIRAGLMYCIFAIYLIKRNFPFYKFYVLPVIFIVYTSLLIPLSSDISGTFREHLRVVSYFIFMMIMYDYYKNIDFDLSSLFKKLPYILLVYIFYTSLANIFGLGNLYGTRRFGGQGDFQTGEIVGDFLLQVSLSIMLIPIFLYYEKRVKKRYFYIIISIFSAIFILLSVRRTAALIIVIGYFLFFAFYKNKTKAFKYLMFFAVASLTILSMYVDTIIGMYETRNRQLTVQSLEVEPRTLEYPVVNNIIFSFDDIKHSFFGKDLYADAGVVPGFHRARTLHTDYARILYGSGIIGLFIYICFITYTIGSIYKTRKIQLPNDSFKIHYATALMLILSKVSLSYTGGMHVISYNALLFGVLGGLLGYMHRFKRKRQS